MQDPTEKQTLGDAPNVSFENFVLFTMIGEWNIVNIFAVTQLVYPFMGDLILITFVS